MIELFSVVFHCQKWYHLTCFLYDTYEIFGRNYCFVETKILCWKIFAKKLILKSYPGFWWRNELASLVDNLQYNFLLEYLIVSIKLLLINCNRLVIGLRITKNIFVRKIVAKKIWPSFVKEVDLFMNIFTFEWIIPVKNINCMINWWNIWILVILN